jgi:hypothetical protein
MLIELRPASLPHDPGAEGGWSRQRMKSSTTQQPANDTTFSPGVYTGAKQALAYAEAAGRACLQVDAAIASGAVDAAQGKQLFAVALALAGFGDPAALRSVAKPRPSQHAGRVALLRLLRAQPPCDDAGRIELRRALRRMDPKLATLTHEGIATESDPNELRWAAALTVQCGAFGDRDFDRAFRNFSTARREGINRRPRHRA